MPSRKAGDAPESPGAKVVVRQVARVEREARRRAADVTPAKRLLAERRPVRPRREALAEEQELESENSEAPYPEPALERGPERPVEAESASRDVAQQVRAQQQAQGAPLQPPRAPGPPRVPRA